MRIHSTPRLYTGRGCNLYHNPACRIKILCSPRHVPSDGKTCRASPFQFRCHVFDQFDCGKDQRHAAPCGYPHLHNLVVECMQMERGLEVRQ